jgi:hypothetical protein
MFTLDGVTLLNAQADMEGGELNRPSTPVVMEQGGPDHHGRNMFEI